MQEESECGIIFNGVFSVRESWQSLPCQEIDSLSARIENALTGPDLGFQRILASEDRSSLMPHVAGTNNWSMADEGVYGLSMSLYDQNPFTYKITADPNADCFGLCKRENNSVLVVCDGVNRGNKSRMAARSAAYGALRYINAHCFEQGEQPMNTHDVFALLHDALMAAHACVCRNVHWCTTICIALVVPLASDPTVHVVCTINVGDSYAFVARKTSAEKLNPAGDDESETFIVEELTITSHDFTKDMGRETGGAIGPVTSNDDPLLNNLTYSLAYVKAGDIVFLTTDGVSDNFDPVVQKINPFAGTSKGAEAMTLQERHTISLQCMQSVLNKFSSRSGEFLSASSLCGELMRHALLMSQDKRAVLEDPDIYSEVTVLNRKSIEKAQRTPFVKSLLANTRGKMDHASICAVTVKQGVDQEPLTGRDVQNVSFEVIHRRDVAKLSRSFKNQKKRRPSKVSLF